MYFFMQNIDIMLVAYNACGIYYSLRNVLICYDFSLFHQKILPPDKCSRFL